MTHNATFGEGVADSFGDGSVIEDKMGQDLDRKQQKKQAEEIAKKVEANIK